MKEIKNISSLDKKSDCVHIYIRGQSFRKDFDGQKACINSLIDCIIRPLSDSGIYVKVSLCTYEHSNDDLFSSLFIKENGVEEFYLEQYKPGMHGKCQIKNFCHVLNKVLNNNDSALILRPDLLFLQKIDPIRMIESKFLFQWNTFHDTSTFEVPDQIHYMGREILASVIPGLLDKPELMGILPNGEGKGSLHNLYNRVVSITGSDSDISYIFYFKITSNYFQGSRCLLRGNPDVSELNNIYQYIRRVSEVENVSLIRRVFRRVIDKIRIVL
ncbi:hypothetical protein E1100_16755 [Vibrio owensii]|uniref:hypothetical protein n=1 Tax=Vibrio owensii TaxID=696485 RepID=UPI0010516A5C|nr:hypothetical protein [Vibrio owensii]TDE21635.1 hypothetical protein E1100_16755 [Vibrio owensii]